MVFWVIMGLLALVVVVRLLNGKPALGINDGKPYTGNTSATDPISASFQAGSVYHNSPAFYYLPGNIHNDED